MFHLLNAVPDADTFPVPPHWSPEGRYDPAPANAVKAMATADLERIDPSDPRTLGPRHASLWYKPLLCCGSLALALVIAPTAAESVHAQSSASPSSRTEKIANALTAAPEEVSKNATVKDWPPKEGEGLVLLRQGTNGWVCLPDDPATRGNDPVCLDEVFHDALVAFFTGQTPKVTRVAYAYMLTSDAEGSNNDPMAKGPTATNQWHHAGPHVMLLYPDPKLLEGLPTKPSAFGPYVMFPGTPIAHVMLPIAHGKRH